jgi:hypothetical protein
MTFQLGQRVRVGWGYCEGDAKDMVGEEGIYFAYDGTMKYPHLVKLEGDEEPVGFKAHELEIIVPDQLDLFKDV